MDTEHRGTDASYQEEVGAQAPAAESQPDVEQSMESLLRENESAFRRLHRGETVEGTVVRTGPDEILVDVGLKSEGVIPAREMFPEGIGEPELQVGDRTLVVVVHPEGAEGHAILSLRRARVERTWREIEEIYQQAAVIEAPVVEHNKGGLIVDVKGVRGFVPVSQVLDLRNVARTEGENPDVSDALAAMIGRRLPLKVIEINRSRNRLILSERAAVQERRTQRKDELMEQLQPGQVRQGVVSNITSFGAFVDLGGADGLVHVSELSYNRVNHPGEVVQVGQQVNVAVLSVDREGKKIALSLKRAQPDPWDTVEQNYHIGQVVNATITKLAKFGAFAKVEEGLEGLIHTSELTDRPITEPGQVVQEGQVLPVKIIQVNSQRRRLGLSARQAQQPYGYGSYGDFETTSPFATSELATFGDETAVSPENGYGITTGEQAPPATETEPEALVADQPGETPEGTPPPNGTEPAQEENSPAAAVRGSIPE